MRGGPVRWLAFRPLQLTAAQAIGGRPGCSCSPPCYVLWHRLRCLRRRSQRHRLTWRKMMRLGHAWTSRIDQRIAELERLKLGLTECIGCGCLSLDRCQLANPGDRAGRKGPGPRYWIGDPAG